MRKFSSYGPVDPDVHYFAPRKGLIDRTYRQLLGDNPEQGGQYITVWAPRQCGKTWLMLEILEPLEKLQVYDVVKVDLEHLKYETGVDGIAAAIAEDIAKELGITIPTVDTLKSFQEIFTSDVLTKPLILILDEFDALPENAINGLVGVFRNIYLRRNKELRSPAKERRYLLHAVALVGVRGVLGIENQKGSPFNVQRSLHIPNLTYEEVDGMFKWYEKESGQKVEQEVIDKLFYETNGQPGLTCWFGELLTEGFEDYQPAKDRPLNAREFEIVYAAATYALPNNNILNIISKAKQEPNKTLLFKMFQTDEKLEFRFDDPTTNSMYMNGVVDKEVEKETKYYIKFSCPFVQKRLFNYFSYEMFQEMGTLVEPFAQLDHVVTETELNIKNLMAFYQDYLCKNRDWLFRDVPRRSDLKVYEAVYHFNLFSYINEFLRSKGGRVYPEFPTGNGQIDLIIDYGGKVYGIELKSYTDQAGYKSALKQAARYGKNLGLSEIFLVIFVERIDDKSREKYEVEYRDREGENVSVIPVFIETG